MNNTPLEPIPTPASQRWHEFRLRWLPMTVFLVAWACVALLWRQHVASPVLVGQVEAVSVRVNCPKAGVLAELAVDRFQPVKAGQVLGRVLPADPQALAAALAVIQADIQALRQSLEPMVQMQRNAINFDQLRLEWMRQRAELGAQNAWLIYAEFELRRNEELAKTTLVAPNVVENARAYRDSCRAEVEQLKTLVAEGERSLVALTNGADFTQLADSPMRAAVAAQEARLRQAETDLGPVLLVAPIDGVVSSLSCRVGEAVAAGQVIVTIASSEAPRIVGYLRAPLGVEPRVGMKVEVRTRSLPRQRGVAEVVQVGNQFEPIPSILFGGINSTNSQVGLALGISLPPSPRLRPGELIDLILLQ
jgi:membrane fusion protein (multidrug efflux system)